ncbi:uncharacterized protein B0H64DRAFT_355180 [Chaetomium fimeti]|uniref:Uncharacterized protein n=1 Tax=Chaetomium fimeti TaxID=1854472 RepID=A0AAE0HMC8_9PEZI|nr:hypothetical protein B0H64DRAFT_355180 [Chaetomium fimeti]
MSGVGLEVLLEDLIPEIAYSGEKGVSITELLKIVRRYHLSLEGKDASTEEDAIGGLQAPISDADFEKSLTDAEMASARWAWDWLRSRPQVLINGNKRWNRLELGEALALPDAGSIDPALAPAPSDSKVTHQTKGKKPKKTLTTRPRIHPAEDLVWQTLTRHGVDYKRVPALEWACLQGVASSRSEGILQSDLRRLVDQDKRSLPKRTDSLARKGYIAKRTVVVQKMKTSRLWLIDFAPPLVEAETCGLDLTPETLSKNLEPVPWHQRWTGNNIDMDALGRTAVGVVKAFNVIRYADLRLKMGVSGKRWQMKTLAKNCQRLVDVGVLKYTAASFPGTRKVFKDCLKFVREPNSEEWDKFLATGKKTSLYSDPTRHREPKPNALALYGKSGEDGQGSSDPRSKVKRIFSGWIPEKPLAQTVFEVIRSAGLEGASNPQVSVATVGYQHRRYLSSYLTKVAETQQPLHLKKFQVVSKLVRTGKTSAYMFSAPGSIGQEALPQVDEREEPVQDQGAAEGSSNATPSSPYGFGQIRPKVFSAGKGFSLADMSRVARRSKPSSKRKLLPRIKPQHLAAAEAAAEAAVEVASEAAVETVTEAATVPEAAAEAVPDVATGESATTPDPSSRPAESNVNGSLKRPFDEMETGPGDAEDAAIEPPNDQEQVPSPNPTAVNEATRVRTNEELILNVRYNSIVGKLQVHRQDRKLTFLRSGRGMKKPVIIPVDDGLAEPIIQDVPETDEKSLVVNTRQTDGAQTQIFVFIFNNEDQANAIWIQEEVTKMRSPDYQVPTPEEIAAASEAIAAATAPSGAARGKGRGGGRGKGKKGQALPAGVKPYVCELCGGAWKNDLGLKYHLEKAQVPCNPSFDPTILLERSRKRRKLSPVPPSVVNSEAGDEEPPGRTRKARGGKKGEKRGPRLQHRVRAAMRSTQDPAHKFRGLKIPNVEDEEGSAGWEPERPKRILMGPSGLEGYGLTVKSVLPTGPSHISRPRAYSSAEPRPFTIGTVLCPRNPLAKNAATQNKSAVVEEDTVNVVTADQPLEQMPSLPTAPATPSHSRNSEDAPVTRDAYNGEQSSHRPLEGFTLRHTNGTPRSNRYDVSPSRKSLMASQSEVAESEYPDLPYQHEGQDSGRSFELETLAPHNDQGGYKPFTRSSNYDRMTSDAKRRTAQAFDIINYLLDNNLGVFPGDKALFYALTNVFLKEFRKQMPPTWKNCTSAVKAIETRKLAALHTHMLKTERGRLQTCTLLIKTGVDPNGIIATRMKQRMRETYPAIFIPPAFSPTQQELALLQELDRKTTDKDNVKPNANGQKFRSRRKIEEIEVFDAPYYMDTAPVVGPKRDPLWIRDTERLVDDGFMSRKRSLDDSSLGPLQKRARAGFQVDEYDDIPVDPSILGDSMPQSQHEQQDGPSVLEAIKAYSLMPAKLGPRGGRRRLSYSYKPLAKLSPELGRIRNPGLESLPNGFFGGTSTPAAIQFVPPVVLILDPNTGLEDEVQEVEEGRSQDQTSSRESTEDILDEVGAEDGFEEAVEAPQTFRFAWPSVLEPVTKGTWPDHSLGFFEHYEGSFTLSGWMPGLKWLQRQNFPTSAEEMAEKQKAEKIRLRDWVDRDYARFCSIVNQCAAWEQSKAGTAVMLGSSVSPGYNFINVSSPLSRTNSRPVTLGWSDDTEYNLETLPYEDLEDDDYDDVSFVDDAERAARDDEPSPKKRRLQKTNGVQVKRLPGRPPKLKLAAIKTMREHTAYPKTADEFLRYDKEDLDWSSENVRLAAFIVVTTLLGGVDRVVDWGLMLRLVPDLTISQLRHYWCALKKDRLSTIVGLTEKFRRAFLRAYENNEVPPIDFNNVLAYDWKALIKWTTKLDMAEWRMLPSTRKALDKTVTVSKFKHGNRPWREAFYHPQRSIFNKFQDATSESLALSVDNSSDPKLSTDMIVSMSWTRSLCVTPVEAYTADAVLHKRNSLFPSRAKTEITELMIKGVDQLQRQGVISKSSSKWSNGRRWRFNTRVLDSLEKSAQQHKFVKAVEFKKELDQAFRAGETKKRVTYITNDGMIMALLNLQANGRVRVKTTGQPNVPMGHEPGNYETRKYTKKYMHFRLDVFPTDAYLYDEPATPTQIHGNQEEEETEHHETEAEAEKEEKEEEDTTLTDLRARIRATAPPTRGPGGAVPVWCDVFGRVDADRWLKYLSAVLITLASRGSMRAEELARTLKPVIMVFEAELVMDWAGRLGLLKAQLGGMAPAVMEWWWIAVEVQREGLREMEEEAAEAAAAAGAGAGVGASGGGGGGKGVGTGVVDGSGSGSGGRQRKALPSARPVRGAESGGAV